MNCNEFKKIINEYVDNELSSQVKEKADNHLKNCTLCEELLSKYKYLSLAVKNCDDEKLPEGFKIEFPEKKNNVVAFFRKHQRAIATMVAAVALVIFANGIEREHYVPETMNMPEYSETIISAPDTSEEDKSAEPTAKPTDKPVQRKNSTEKKIVSTEDNKPSATENVVLEENTFAVPESTSDEVQNTNETNETIAMMRALPSPASSGASEADEQSDDPKTDIETINSDEIFSYILPAADMFENEEIYNDFEQRLSDIRNRASESTDENMHEVFDEYKALVNEIENNMIK